MSLSHEREITFLMTAVGKLRFSCREKQRDEAKKKPDVNKDKANGAFVVVECIS